MAVVNGTIAAGADDVQIYNDGTWHIATTATTIYFGKNASLPDLGVFRFVLSAAIPSGATISSAIFSIYSTGNSYAVDDAWVYVTESADGAQVTAVAGRPTWADTGGTTTYPTTMEGASAVHWTGTWPETIAVVEIEVKTLIQHLVDTYGGLASAAHVVVWIDGDDAYTNSESAIRAIECGTNVPTLTITYTEGQTPGGGAADDRFRFRPSQRI
jgi:hypothetical protein